MFTRILVPTDFSAPSDAALEYARGIAAKFGSRIHVLHVLDEALVATPYGNDVFVAESPTLLAELFDEAKNRLAHRASRPDGAPFTVTTEVVSGTSARTITDYAGEHAVDLIVMGTHGRSGVAHLLMGSVAEKVVRFAPCPVLIVRSAPVPLPAFAEPARNVVAA
jgi:nucleotide-binding universal stress UspA family protein